MLAKKKKNDNSALVEKIKNTLKRFYKSIVQNIFKNKISTHFQIKNNDEKN